MRTFQRILNLVLYATLAVTLIVILIIGVSDKNMPMVSFTSFLIGAGTVLTVNHIARVFDQWAAEQKHERKQHSDAKKLIGM